MVIFDIILPIFLIIFLGYLLSQYGRVATQAFSRAQLYVLSPALVFVATGRAEVSTALIFDVFIFIAIIEAFLFVVSQGVGLASGRSRPVRHAFSLTSMFMNSGFYGIPVCMLAFGEKGFIYAVTFVVASSVLQTSVGIYLAASGSSRPSDALRSVLKVPVLYAIVVARVVAHYDLYPSESFMKVIEMLGHSAIPIGLLLLGMQLQRIVDGIRGRGAAVGAVGVGGLEPPSGGGEAVAGTGERLVGAADRGNGGYPVEGETRHEGLGEMGGMKGEVSSSMHGEDRPPGAEEPTQGTEDLLFGTLAALVRLGGGFAAAMVVLLFFDFDPLLRKVLIVEASMPTAVNTVVYATEFRCRPSLAAVAVLVSTLLSIVTIPLILRFLS